MAAITGAPFELTLWPTGSAATISNFTLNQSTDAIEFIFQAQEDATITRLGIRQGTVTGTSPVYKISLQGVTDGVPDGTILGGGSPASTTFTPVGGGNSTWSWKTLDNSVSITRGTWYAVVLAYSSGTVDASNNCSFGYLSAVGVLEGTRYAISNDNGSRTRNSTSPIFGYGSSGTAYGFPANSVGVSGFNSGSTPDEKALLLNIPTTWWSTYKVLGAALYGAFASTTTYDLVLYDTDGTTVLQTINIDADNDRSASASVRRVIFFDESTLSTLNAGSSYRLAFKPGGTSLVLTSLTVAATADLDAYAGGASVAQGSTRTDGGAWTNDNLTRYGINPILADITAPTASGGSGLTGNYFPGGNLSF